MTADDTRDEKDIFATLVRRAYVDAVSNWVLCYYIMNVVKARKLSFATRS
jgi:hypothetical protein